MKVFIDVDELYPFFYHQRMTHDKMSEIGAVGTEISLETVHHIERVMKEFWEVQKMLHDLYGDNDL